MNDETGIPIWLSCVNAAISAVRAAADLLPNADQKKAAQVAIASAEQALAQAKYELAADAGYRMCRKHYPPGICLENDSGSSTCPVCGKNYVIGGIPGRGCY